MSVTPLDWANWYGHFQVVRLLTSRGALVNHRDKVRQLLILGVHVQQGLQYLVCKSVSVFVCLSVTTFSASTLNKGRK